MAATKIMPYTEFVYEEIVDLYSDSEFINKWNDYCEDINDLDSQIYGNDEDFLDSFEKLDLVSRVQHSNYSFDDNYVTINAYGHFESSPYPQDLGSKGVLSDWIVKNQSEADAYIDYVERQIKDLSLNEALRSFVDFTERKYILDDSVSEIELAIENSLETLVKNSSLDDIKAAIKLNESNELVDLSDLKDYVNLDELATDTQHSQAKTPSLADDLQAARQAADKQETVNPQGTLKHTNKL